MYYILRKLIQNLKLKYKFFSSYLILLFIPVVFISVFFYYRFTTISNEQVQQIIDQSLKQAAMHISYINQGIVNTGEMLFNNNNIHEILKKDHETIYEQMNDYSTLQNIVEQVKSNTRISNIRFFVSDNKIYSNNNEIIMPKSKIEIHEFFYSILNQNNSIGWLVNQNQTPWSTSYLSYYVIIRDLDNFDKINGYLFIDLDKKIIQDILSEIKIWEHSYTLLLDDKKNIISTLKSENFVDGFDTLLLEQIDFPLKTDFGEKRLRIENIMYSVNFRKIPGTTWNIVFIMPPEVIQKDSLRKVSELTFIIVLCFIVFSIITSFLLSNLITKSLKKLVREIETINKINDYESLKEIDSGSQHFSQDEIGELHLNFSIMVKRIQKLFIEYHKALDEKQDIEIKLLRAQINPHFLYNALDLINWRAVRIKAFDISNIVTNLGSFYRLSLSNWKVMIEIAEEIEQVKLYLQIQEQSFPERIYSDFQISEEILKLYTINMILQPAVENAIIHGIMNKPELSGNILIKGYIQEDTVIIKVMDDGPGPDEVKKIYLEGNIPSRLKSTKLGIRNIDQRIKINFGERYGLRLYRTSKNWTVTEIQIPLINNIE